MQLFYIFLDNLTLFMLVRHLSHPLYAPIIAALAALSGALISQYIFGAHPCQLCIWQRYPYSAIIALGALAWFMRRHKPSSLFLIVAGILFLATAAIAMRRIHEPRSIAGRTQSTDYGSTFSELQRSGRILSWAFYGSMERALWFDVRGTLCYLVS
ncbi:MAG: disulfide bond formation protein B [Alphaproteobacteria bacterium]|nr:MAG: disulfide bond formation protein B [Alphaproteobacteria bacterium]